MKSQYARHFKLQNRLYAYTHTSSEHRINIVIRVKLLIAAFPSETEHFGRAAGNASKRHRGKATVRFPRARNRKANSNFRTGGSYISTASLRRYA